MPSIEYVTFADGAAYVFYNVTGECMGHWGEPFTFTRLRCVWMICAGDE